MEQEKDREKERVGGRPAKLNMQKGDRDLERQRVEYSRCFVFFVLGIAVFTCSTVSFRGAYHLTENFGNSGWKVNGRVTFRKFQPKIEEYVLR